MSVNTLRDEIAKTCFAEAYRASGETKLNVPENLTPDQAIYAHWTSVAFHCLIVGTAFADAHARFNTQQPDGET